MKKSQKSTITVVETEKSVLTFAHFPLVLYLSSNPISTVTKQFCTNGNLEWMKTKKKMKNRKLSAGFEPVPFISVVRHFSP